ncbi:MAG: glutamate-ammonia-ligase adenylyltransferase [Desulfatiglandales bacterium]
MATKPDIAGLKKALPEIAPPFLEEHLARLSDRYFNRFSEKEIADHIKGLSEITPESPAKILLRSRRDGTVDCTVLAFDYPSEFSLITGVLAAMGFSILSGDVFTYKRKVMAPSRDVPRRKGPVTGVLPDLLRRRRIIDHFTGVVHSSLAFNVWADEFTERLTSVIGLLEGGEDDKVNEAKHQVNEMVVQRLPGPSAPEFPVLYPVRIEVGRQNGPFTSLRVVSEDTPAFLYSLSNALSLQGIVIEHVRIRTIRGRIEDRMDLVDLRGGRIKDGALLERLKVLVLLTKQFTYFLGKAPDPYRALSRFENLVKDILRHPEKGKWLDSLTAPETLTALARLLGTSDYLWEDFIRLQYETLLPMLRPHVVGRRFSTSAEALKTRMEQAMQGARTLEEQQRCLNEFKDREIFLIDLDHILDPHVDFRVLSGRLTLLAETVVDAAAALVYADLVKAFGRPRTSAGLEAAHAVLGLGKLGGAALGYASDIELLFVYSDNGRTDGDPSLTSAEFFERMAGMVRQAIKAKREGIFHVDMRLRPYGNAGPLASSLDGFCHYYGRGGQAHTFERLALVRLRVVGGDPAFGSRIERLRDELVYFSGALDFDELRNLRERQFREKTEGGRPNAKFSPGGLVDLEYGVQILQIMHGKDFPRLRTPILHESLAALAETDLMAADEAGKLVQAYDFLRNLINGLRMLRGSAEDLFLPREESMEYRHLARRMGYETGGPLEPAHALSIDFETHTANVRLFVERYFGRGLLPGPETGTIADLILSAELPEGSRHRILLQANIRDPGRAHVNLAKLAGEGSRREAFARLSLLAWDILMQVPDPDMALNNWERFIHALASPESHYRRLLSQPMHLEILLKLFAGSQFLSDTLVRHPGFLDWVMIPGNLHEMRERRDIEEDLRSALHHCAGHREWLNILRRLRRREMLRIGAKDLCLRIPTRHVMLELSRLADAITEVSLEGVWKKWREGGEPGESIKGPEEDFCILALGKLGGNELNYSSDIDLLGLRDDGSDPVHPRGRAGEHRKELFSHAMEALRSDLSIHTEEGCAYRVDLRLRPFGRAGELVPSLSGLTRYYLEQASVWEVQAAIKMRPVAGNLGLGYRLLEGIRPIFLEKRDPVRISECIERMRCGGVKAASGRLGRGMDVKTGKGGLRDIEFLVQGLQLMHAWEDPALLEGNTLRALDLLGEARILPQRVVEQLKDDYDYMRRIEHCLQIFDDRQIHSLPRDPAEIEALSKRILGTQARGVDFLADLDTRFIRTRKAYFDYLIKKTCP